MLIFLYLVDQFERLENVNWFPANDVQFQGVKEIKILELDAAIKRRMKCNLLVVILQVTPSRLIDIKHGHMAGNQAELASIMVGDESMFYVTIMLWNKNACLSNHLGIGDIVVIKDIVFNTRNGKNIARSTDTSIIFNFGRPREGSYPKFCRFDFQHFILDATTILCEKHTIYM